MTIMCPNCRGNDCVFLEKRENAVEYNYCWDCDYLWKTQDGNFIAGAVVAGGEQDFPSFNTIEIEVVKSLNLKDTDHMCIFCNGKALKNPDTDEYFCSKCGGSWEVNKE